MSVVGNPNLLVSVLGKTLAALVSVVVVKAGLVAGILIDVSLLVMTDCSLQRLQKRKLTYISSFATIVFSIANVSYRPFYTLVC